MGRNRCITWVGLWWGCLLCVLSVTATAGTVSVNLPGSDLTVINSTALERVGTNLRVTGALQGEYIPRPDGTRLSVKVKPVADFSIPRTINALKPLVRGGFVGALAAAGVAWAIDQIPGASFDPQTGELVKAPAPIIPSATYWNFQSVNGNTVQTRYASASQACSSNVLSPQVNDYKVEGTTCWVRTKPDICPSCSFYVIGYMFSATINCPNGVNTATLTCNSTKPAPVPFAEPDYNQLFANLESITNSEWLKGLLEAACAGSNAPGRCFDELKERQQALVGPASVPAGTTTTTSTYVKPDGTVGERSSVTNTNIKITYGPNNFTYNESKSTTHYDNGVETGTETTEETPPPDAEPSEEQQGQPVPCTANCDGPAYEDLYEPVDTTKEDELDSYQSRLASVPIFAALGQYFSVTVPSSSCPVWSYNGSLNLLFTSMPIDLTFDHHCLPWFVDLKPYIQIIVIFMFTMLAVRVGLL